MASESDGKSIGKELLSKHQENAHAIEGIDARIKRLADKRREHEKNIEAILATAKLFGISTEAFHPQLPLHIEKAAASTTKMEAHPARNSETPTVKNFVLERAEKSYPQPVRASILRKELMKIRDEEIHEKTVGMTLYRLLQKGFLRREKFDWFFIPENQRTKRNPAQSDRAGVFD